MGTQRIRIEQRTVPRRQPGIGLMIRLFARRRDDDAVNGSRKDEPLCFAAAFIQPARPSASAVRAVGNWSFAS